ncbi:MAG: glycosyltransferase [Planctomycetota bacterium]
MRTILVVQPVLPDYRIQFFNLLHRELGDKLQLVVLEEAYETGVRSVSDTGLPVRFSKYRWLCGKRLLWHHDVVGQATQADGVVMPLNPRMLDVWYVLLHRSIRRKPIVLWGHMSSRSGEARFSAWLRSIMFRLASAILLYTETECASAVKRFPRKKILSMRNALYRKDQLTVLEPQNPPVDLIYVGRLVPEKKPLFLIRAFAAALQRLPDDAQLHIVGDGGQRRACEGLVEELGVTDRVILHGHQADVDELRTLYSKALFSISPGYVGLSLTQSLGFGVPMLVSDNEPHSPEIEALREGENAMYFTSDDQHDFVETLLACFEQAHKWIALRETISEDCKNRYSVEAMVDAMLEALGSPCHHDAKESE